MVFPCAGYGKVMRATLLVLMILFSGCISNQGGGDTSIDDSLGYSDEVMVPALSANNNESAKSLRMQIKETGASGGEPMVGRLFDGSLVVSARDDLVAFDGTSWSVVRSESNLDPLVWADAASSTIYHPIWDGSCLTVSFSQDLGATWIESSSTCALGLGDQAKFIVVPGSDGRQWLGCYAYIQSAMCSESSDAGETWSPATPAFIASPVNDCNYDEPQGVLGRGQIGQPVFSDEGNPLIPKSRGCGTLHFITKEGDAWAAEDTQVAIDPFGRSASAAWLNGQPIGLVQTESMDSILVFKNDVGWESIDVTPPGIETTVFSALDVFPDGTVIGAFLGSSTKGSPSTMPDDSIWDLYVFTWDGALVQYRPLGDPVQVGCIWVDGGSNPCRNLLDFMHGRVTNGIFDLALADGCVDDCIANPSASLSRSSEISVLSFSL
jgi:hypothetical protein